MCKYQSVQDIPLADDNATRRSAWPVLFAEHEVYSQSSPVQSHSLHLSRARYDWTTQVLVACLCVVVVLTVFYVRSPYPPVHASLAYLTVVTATSQSVACKRYLIPIPDGFTMKGNMLTTLKTHRATGNRNTMLRTVGQADTFCTEHRSFFACVLCCGGVVLLF